MNYQFDVIVVGGGVVGLASALAMALRGFSVAIIDTGKLTADLAISDPRVYAINQASQDLLHTLGVWDYLDSKCRAAYRQMYVWDAASGAHIQFDARIIASDQLGTILAESVLKHALIQRLNEQKSHVGFFAEHTVTEIEAQQRAISVTAEQTSWQGKLLMVADGANSQCRQLLQVPLTTWPYHQQAIVASVSTEVSHQHTAFQVFNADGTLAFLPLNNERQCSIVWATTPAYAKQLMALAEEEFNQHLQQAFASRLGKVAVEGKRYQFPLVMRHTKQYAGDRWLLLGDAAHTIHPLAGLGLNVGLADVATWMACLEQHHSLLALKKALGGYQRQRKYAVWQIIAVMDGFKSLFTNPLPPIVALRGWGLTMCNAFTPLKRMFIEQAAGKRIN